MGYCFGIDIGGTTVKIGLAAEDGTLLEGWEIPTRREPTPEGLLLDIRVSILDRLDRELDRGKKQKIRRADILGIGMAAPGAVTADGILHGAVNIGWGDVALAEEAERIIGISPVCVGNDARLAALGEAAYGAGVGGEEHAHGDAWHGSWRRRGAEREGSHGGERCGRRNRAHDGESL